MLNVLHGWIWQRGRNAQRVEGEVLNPQRVQPRLRQCVYVLYLRAYAVCSAMRMSMTPSLSMERAVSAPTEPSLVMSS